MQEECTLRFKDPPNYVHVVMKGLKHPMSQTRVNLNNDVPLIELDSSPTWWGDKAHYPFVISGGSRIFQMRGRDPNRGGVFHRID